MVLEHFKIQDMYTNNVKSCVTFESFALKYSTFIQTNFVHQVINTPIAMENIAVKRKWRKMTHWVVTMVNYVMEAKSASKVGAVRVMPITNVQTKSVEISLVKMVAVSYNSVNFELSISSDRIKL